MYVVRFNTNWTDLTAKLDLADFGDSIILDREPLITSEDGKKSLELILATYLFSDTGKPVDLPLVE